MTEIERLRKLREQVKRVIEAEPELDGPMPDNVRRALADSPESMLRATVRVTKDNIAASARALLDAAIAEAEREQVGASPAGHSTLREAFADLCHEQWTGWMRYLFSRAKVTDEGALIPYGWACLWQRQMGTPYADLSLEEQESDRKEADRFLALLARHEPVQPEPVTQGAGYPSEPSEHDSPPPAVLSDGRGMTPAGSPSVFADLDRHCPTCRHHTHDEGDHWCALDISTGGRVPGLVTHLQPFGCSLHEGKETT